MAAPRERGAPPRATQSQPHEAGVLSVGAPKRGGTSQEGALLHFKGPADLLK